MKKGARVEERSDSIPVPQDNTCVRSSLPVDEFHPEVLVRGDQDGLAARRPAGGPAASAMLGAISAT